MLHQWLLKMILHQWKMQNFPEIEGYSRIPPMTSSGKWLLSVSKNVWRCDIKLLVSQMTINLLSIDSDDIFVMQRPKLVQVKRKNIHPEIFFVVQCPQSFPCSSFRFYRVRLVAMWIVDWASWVSS